MDFTKIYKRGLGISVLLLFVIVGGLFVPNLNKNYISDGISLFTSGPDDAYEPNDTVSNAYDLTMWEDYWLSSISGYGILEDDDFYLIDVKTGFDHLQVNLIFNHSMGNIDIEILNTSLVVVTGSTTMTDNEYIDFMGIIPGIYYMRVFGPNFSNTYDLWWKTYQVDDAYEPNNDWTSAYDLTPYQDVWLSSILGPGRQFDDDWYKIYISPGYEFLHVSLLFNHSMGDIDIALYNSTYSFMTSSTDVMDNEYIDFIVPSWGDYYLQIYYGNMGNQYDLLWHTTTPLDDAYEENDYDGEAYDLSPWSASWLPYGLGYQFDDDWYTVYLDPGEERIYAELVFSHAAGNIDMELWYWDGSLIHLTGSYSYDDNEYIDFEVPWSGIYYLRIFGDNTGNSYDLWWEDLMPTSDDWMEDNDDFSSARYVDPNYYSGLKLVYGDEDWFKTDLKKDDTIEISIYFNHMEGDLELQLYDPSGGLRFGSYTSDNEEHIFYNADMPGQWRFQVYHVFADSIVYYDLDIWRNAGEDLKDDRMEENDGFWSSWYVDPNYYTGLILNNDDEDWFHTYLNEGDVIDVSLNFDHGKGNLELELWSPSQSLRAGSYNEYDYEYISFMADMSGDWRVRVYHADADSKVNYDLGIWIKDDYYEWNNHPDDMMGDGKLHMDHPSVLIQNERTWLSNLHGLAVQEYDDWYFIEITPGFEHLRLELTFNHSLGNIDVEIYGQGSSLPLVSSTSITDNEHIDYLLPDPLPQPEIFAVRVYGDDMRNKYDMWWDDIRNDTRSDDNYEINNDAISAYDISWALNMSLWGIDGLAIQYDQDWYEVYVDETGLELIVLLIYDSAEGLMGFEVYDWDLNKITGNFTIEDNDYIIYPVSNGTYYIRVYGDNSGNIYNLWWGTRPHEEGGMIPGYDLFILIASILGITTIVIKLKRSKFKKN